MKVARTISPGIYQMENGSYRVVARVGDRKTGPPPKEKRFPAGTALKAMKRWQEERRAELRRTQLRPALGTLAADVQRYIAHPEVTRLASSKSRKADTNAWVGPFGHLRRDQIAAEQIEQQIEKWRAAGIAVWTVRHRLNALRQVYSVLDGRTAYNPARKVKAPPKPRAIPRALDYATIRTALNQMEPSATKGFLIVMAFCGFRPSEVRRTEPWMLRLDTESPHVIRPTAKGGDTVVVPLSDEGVLGWQMFRDHGGFNTQKNGKGRTFANANRDWKAAMKRADFIPTRSYDLVHSYCTQLLMAGGGDISLVQKARGHRDIRTTMVYTQVVIDPRLASVVRQAFRTAK